MKKEFFLLDLIKSFPFRILILLVLFIILGVSISKCREKKVQMKEDVLYIHPKPKL